MAEDDAEAREGCILKTEKLINNHSDFRTENTCFAVWTDYIISHLFFVLPLVLDVSRWASLRHAVLSSKRLWWPVQGLSGNRNAHQSSSVYSSGCQKAQDC